MIVGTYGVNLEMDLKADITGYTLIEMVIVAPTKPETRTVVEAIAVDQVKGLIRYVTEPDIFNRVATYKVQAIVTFGVTKLLKSTPENLKVGPAL